MSRITKGMLAKAKAGHDTGKIYVIIDADEEYVYLVDGISRSLDRPKKKKMKHIQIINQMVDIEGADDVRIKKMLKDYKRCAPVIEEEK